MSKNQSTTSKNNILLPLSKPALRALEAAGITKLEDFTFISESELLNLHGMGLKAVRLISEALVDQDLHFAKKNRSKKNNSNKNN